METDAPASYTSAFSERDIRNATSQPNMTAAPAEESNAGTATRNKTAKAAGVDHEENQSRDGNQDQNRNQGQGRDQSDCDGPYLCDCRLWYVTNALCCSLFLFGSPP